jgi:hypothetical protein
LFFVSRSAQGAVDQVPGGVESVYKKMAVRGAQVKGQAVAHPGSPFVQIKCLYFDKESTVVQLHP